MERFQLGMPFCALMGAVNWSFLSSLYKVLMASNTAALAPGGALKNSIRQLSASSTNSRWQLKINAPITNNSNHERGFLHALMTVPIESVFYCLQKRYPTQ
jgi:hypothetical protein